MHAALRASRRNFSRLPIVRMVKHSFLGRVMSWFLDAFRIFALLVKNRGFKQGETDIDTASDASGAA